MKVFILANGLGTRWIDTPMFQGSLQTSFPGDMNYEAFPPKQLLQIGNTSIIQRTIDQVRKNICSSIILSAPGIICRDIIGVQNMIAPRYSGELLSGILQLHKMWDEEVNLFLLGDVVFSNSMIAEISGACEIANCSNGIKPMLFFGRIGSNRVTGKEASELFGVLVTKSGIETLRKTCLDHNDPSIKNGSGKLWTLYKEFTKDKENPDDFLVQSQDFTDDIDSPKEYQEFWSSLSLAALRDDSGK